MFLAAAITGGCPGEEIENIRKMKIKKRFSKKGKLQKMREYGMKQNLKRRIND